MSKPKQVNGSWVEPITVKKNDNLWKITKANGYDAKRWREYYDAPYNKTFKKNHPNPHLIYAKDVFHLPCKGNFYMKRELQKQLRAKISRMKKDLAEIKKLSDKTKKVGVKAIKDAKKTRELGDWAQVVVGLVTGLATASGKVATTLADDMVDLFKDLAIYSVGKGSGAAKDKNWGAWVVDNIIKYNDPNHWGQFIGQLSKGKSVWDAWSYDFDKEAAKLEKEVDSFYKGVEKNVNVLIADLEAEVKALN